jgi:hypothetical protein
MAFHYPTLLDARQSLFDHQEKRHGNKPGESGLAGLFAQAQKKTKEQASRAGGLPTEFTEDGTRRTRNAEGTPSGPPFTDNALGDDPAAQGSEEHEGLDCLLAKLDLYSKQGGGGGGQR